MIISTLLNVILSYLFRNFVLHPRHSRTPLASQRYWEYRDLVMSQTPRKHWKPSIGLLNVNKQSNSAKKLEFQYMVEDAKPDIIVACETWLKPNINSSEFMPPGYDPPFRNDRADGYEGVMIAIKTGLVAERIYM